MTWRATIRCQFEFSVDGLIAYCWFTINRVREETMKNNITASLIIVASLSGCANVDRYLRPEGAFYFPQPSNVDDLKVELVAGNTIRLNCLDKDGEAVTKSKLNQSELQCLYFSADVTDVISGFKISPSPALDLAQSRNYMVSFLMNLAGQNCETFLNRAFANKSSLDTTKNAFQDILTGASAASATAAPPAAAGLSLANLVLGKSVDNINSTFFFEKAFQAIGSAIYLERTDIRDQMLRKFSHSYMQYTIFDALGDVRRYESACSIRVGVSKLQSLTEDRSREKAESERRYLALVEVISKSQAADKRIQIIEKELKDTSIKSAAEKQAIQDELAKLKDEKQKADAHVAALQEVAKLKVTEETVRVKAQVDEAGKQAEIVIAKSLQGTVNSQQMEQPEKK